MTAPLRIENLRREHAVEGFDCGREELNRYLTRFALANGQAGAAQTYLALSGDADKPAWGSEVLPRGRSWAILSGIESTGGSMLRVISLGEERRLCTFVRSTSRTSSSSAT